MTQCQLAGITLDFDERTLAYTVTAHGRTWQGDPAFRPCFTNGEATVYFDQAKQITSHLCESGLGKGIRTEYSGFEGFDAVFETICTIQAADGRVLFTFVPLRMPPHVKVTWPGTLVADAPGDYAVINHLQGYLLPSDWPHEAPALAFGGQMASCSAYMPWFGMVAADGAYLCVVQEPWDASYAVKHPAGGPTRIETTALPSLGKMARQHTYTYTFLPADSDYVSLCKVYRKMAAEEGRFTTLREKAVKLPAIDRLIGSSVMHVCAKTHMSPDSAYYDHENPASNDTLVPFSTYAKQVPAFKAMGIERLYLHLDGWGDPGYDNKHPDYLPACEAAGGWEGLKGLQDALHAEGYLFGLHDQYRDYYLDAPTYDPDNAVQLADGTIFEMARWAGGKQTYLCSSLAPDYVRRNFEQLFAHGIQPDATYLDVFTCNEPDECINPRHVVTRAESLAYRAECFDYLTAHGIIPSSEEANDWAMNSLVFCHWAPYAAKAPIPVPLFNLVYHDSFLIPWKLIGDTWGIPEGDSGFLHALLNGGMGYLETEFEGEALSDNVEKCKVVSELQRKVAYCEMVSHAFLYGDERIQRTVFSDGTVVTVNFADESYTIDYAG